MHIRKESLKLDKTSGASISNVMQIAVLHLKKIAPDCLRCFCDLMHSDDAVNLHLRGNAHTLNKFEIK